MIQIRIHDGFSSYSIGQYLKIKAEYWWLKFKSLKYLFVPIPFRKYGLEKLIQDILNHEPKYDKFYSEHKPVGKKLEQMTKYLERTKQTKEEYVRQLILGETKYLHKEYHYRKKYGKDWIFHFYYDGVDFWITENYCWERDDRYEMTDEDFYLLYKMAVDVIERETKEALEEN